MGLSTLELELFRCGTLELELFRCGRVVPMEGGDVEDLSMGMDVSVGGRVVEIEDESCIDTERRQARQQLTRRRGRGVAGATEPARRPVTHGIGSLGDVGKRGAESLKCN